MTVLEEAEVLNIAVDPARRGASLGGRLLDAGISEARSRGAHEIFLEVRESNVAALDLYRSRGFEAIARRKKYYRTPVEDALVLRRAM
jgi:ribosomal-protein-alanine N-acetyltransferase